MNLRPYLASDLDALHKLDQSCFPSGVAYEKEELAAFIGHRNSRTWVAEAEGKIVGFLVAASAPGRAVHIITIDVTEAWRRRAVGSALMEAAEAWARAHRAPAVSLEVSERNLAAQAFYARRGYDEVERLENYYVNGERALVLRRLL